MGPCFSTHLIDENGTFNVGGIEHFAKEAKLAECGLSYAVVAIMGPKSSGKSTLLNLLFLTDFKEMDAQQGRSKTTKGVWLARSGIIMTPCTLVMDLEGTDGKDRGEDNSAFEKQIALFALAVSDILLINMWCHDICREQAANRPLLKTIFQQVTTRLFSPRKTTLMFVIRDKTRTPLVELERVLREDIQKIWNSVPKPQAHKDTPLSEFFNVEVVALSSYKDDREQFYEELASLRLRFFNSTEAGGLAGDRSGAVHGTAFPSSAQQIWKVIKEDKDPIWKVIKEDKDPHLPDLKVMVAIRCEAIAVEMLDRFKEAFDKALNTGKGFAAAARDSTDYFMSQFDAASADVQISQANWDSSEVREKLRRDIDAHIAAVRIAKLAELTTMYEKKLSEALGGPTEALLDAARDDTMATIRAIFRHETITAVSRFSGALRSFEIEDSTENTMIKRLKDYARGVVEAKVKEEAQRVLDRFSASVLRVCTGNEDIQAIIETARSASLRLLSVMAAIRLDDNDADSIENTLSLALIEAGSSNSLDSSSWDEVPLSKTLLTPIESKSLWRKFESGMDLIVKQAIARRKQARTADIIGTIAKVVAAGAIIAYAAYLAATSSSTTR